MVDAGAGAGAGAGMAASVTCGWKCGKEFGAIGSGCRDISFWRSAASGSEGTSQTAMTDAPSGGIVIMIIRSHS